MASIYDCNFEKKNKITKEKNDKVEREFNYNIGHLTKIFYVMSDLVKRIRPENKQEYSDKIMFEYDLDYILNIDLNELIVDENSFDCIDKLRRTLVEKAGYLNELDRQYLQLIGFKNEFDNDLNEITNFNLQYFLEQIARIRNIDFPCLPYFSMDNVWALLLCSEEQLKMMRCPDEGIELIKDVLKALGFSLREKSYKELGIVGQELRFNKVVNYKSAKKYMIKDELVKSIREWDGYRSVLEDVKVHDNLDYEKQLLINQIEKNQKRLEEINNESKKLK